MAENTKIEWATHTFNHVEGCTKVSAGCANCYAEAQAKRFGRVKWGPESAGGTRRVASENYWHQAVKWNKAAEGAAERPRVFCASIADVFEDWQGPMVNSAGGRLSIRNDHTWDSELRGDRRPLEMSDVRDRLFNLIEDTPNLDWLLLTKRPENIVKMMPTRWHNGMPVNVWLGTSVENQETADKRIPELLKVKAAVNFLSMEPLLEAVDLEYPESIWPDGPQRCCDGRECGCMGLPVDPPLIHGINWVIVGGESGHTVRKCDIEWLRSIRDQCERNHVAFFAKQAGGAAYEGDRRISLTDKKGGDWQEWPADLRIREFPKTSRSI